MPDLSDTQLTRAAAELMGWRVYEDAAYEDWLACIERKQAADTCNIDSAGLVWRYDRRLIEWRPLASMDDAMMLINKMQADDWDYELGSCIEGHSMFFERGIRDPYTDTREESYEATASTPQRAVVLAAVTVGKHE